MFGMFKVAFGEGVKQSMELLKKTTVTRQTIVESADAVRIAMEKAATEAARQAAKRK
jgi:hypothetical protein